jgi:hypothetical protein
VSAVGERAWFEEYLAAFNRADFDAFGAYYHEDVAFHGRAATLVGRQAVLDFYRGVRARIDEHIELVSFLGSPDRCAVEIVTNLMPLEDWPDFPAGALFQGQLRRSVNFVFYDIVDDRFSRIRSAGFQRLA